MDYFRLVSGNIIEIKAKTSTAVKVMRAINDDENYKTIRLDGTIRSNIGASIGDEVKITPIKITDKNGKSSLVTQRTNRRTGEVEYITQDIDGQFAGTANLTANQKTQLSNDIEQGKADIKLDTELKLENQ